MTQKILCFLAFFYALSFYNLTYLHAMEDESPSERKYFSSPAAISCHSPIMVSFQHEDNLDMPQTGDYGEKVSRMLFKKYALIKNTRGPSGSVECFKTGDPSGNGFDFVMVDHEERKVLLLEAKSQSFRNDTPKKGKASMAEASASEKKKIHFILMPEGGNIPGEVKIAMKRRLDSQQLSRTWCSQSLEHRKSDECSSSKEFEHARLFRDIFDILEKKEGYKFLRMCSMTYIDFTSQATPVTTYYSIVRDGDSEEPYEPGNQRLMERILNGGLAKHFLHETELNIEDSIRYLKALYDLVKGHKYSVDWVDPQVALESKRKKPDSAPEPESASKALKFQGAASASNVGAQSDEPIPSSEMQLLSPREHVFLPEKDRSSMQEGLKDTDEGKDGDTHRRKAVRKSLSDFLTSKNVEICIAELEIWKDGKGKDKNAAMMALKILKNEVLSENDQKKIKEILSLEELTMESFLKKERDEKIKDIFESTNKKKL